MARAAVVIAHTYPFNPAWEAEIRATNGPISAGITNRVSQIYKVLLELELRRQGVYRRQGSHAALSRTQWEIAYQELLLAGRVMSTFNAVLYRRQKLQIVEETFELNAQTLERVNALQGTKTTAADAIFARTELDDARALLGVSRAVLVTAQNDLRRQLGVVDVDFDLIGHLDPTVDEWEVEVLTKAALENRPDLRGKAAAVAEAEAQLSLAIANRYGNPTAGPSYEYDPSRINLIGVQFSLPLPILNTHKGDIFQRQAERDRANLEVRQNEIQIRQDVKTALDRLHAAGRLVKTYENQILPSLRRAQKDIGDLFEQGTTDVFHIIDVRRKLLRAREGYLDALFEVSQARAELAIAVGDPALPSAR
jgi:outer membrane protein TolC